MEIGVILQLVGSIGFPGAILILLIFLANKHLPGMISNLYGIKAQLELLTKSVEVLASKSNNRHD